MAPPLLIFDNGHCLTAFTPVLEDPTAIIIEVLNGEFQYALRTAKPKEPRVVRRVEGQCERTDAWGRVWTVHPGMRDENKRGSERELEVWDEVSWKRNMAQILLQP
jgi:hypothetical protein